MSLAIDNVSNFLSSKNRRICLPIVIDTEFWGSKRKCATIQLTGTHNLQPKMFVHQNLIEYATETNRLDEIRHKTIKTEFAVIDYLNSVGIKASIISRSEFNKKSKKDKESSFKRYSKNLPTLQIDVFSHFALAELLMMVDGQCKEDLIKIIRFGKHQKIELKRRLKVFTNGETEQVLDGINLPWLVTIEDIKFKVKLRIIDTCALHGIASYSDLCNSTSIQLTAKNELDDYKHKMNEAYFDRPQIFDEYGLGDLEVYNILDKNANNFRRIYENLDINEFFTQPKLTIGATVQNLFKAKVFKYLGVDFEDKETQTRILELSKHGSALSHKTYVHTTRCLLAKVNGGRCRNNKPTTSYLQGTIIDADIDGAYGNGLRFQDYPLGRPIIEDYENIEGNRYLTIRQWLKERKYGKKNCDLVDGLWVAFVSNAKNKDGSHQTLRIRQDFLSSWFDFKFEDIASMNTDSDNLDLEINPKTGKIKIFNYQVINGVINSDFLDWLFNVASAEQRNEILDNLYINVSCYYPSYSRVETLEDLLDAYDNWNEDNTVKSEKKQYKSHKLPSGQVIKINNQPTYWLGINIGELVIDDLLAYRKLYQAKDGKKSPMQTLFKLVCNTLYGVFCSPYFDISNTVVGNNITARCRAMSWYMEKGLFGNLTITDGCQLDINKVCYPTNKNRKLTGYNTVNLYSEKNTVNQNIFLKPLDNADKIEHFYDDDVIKLKVYKDGQIEIIDNATQWVNTKLLEHLQKQFKVTLLHRETLKLGIDIEESIKENKPVKNYKTNLGVFSIEIKDIYDYGCFHGASNYLLANKNNRVFKMRSYENKKHHYTFEMMENDQYIETSVYDENVPSEKFLQQLINRVISRSVPFKKTGILKVNEFRNNPKWYLNGYVCGDSIEKTGMLKEVSLSQFTYRDMAQYLAIEREYEINKRRYEQSYEGYFVNEDNTLNYQDMIEILDKLIREGVTSINKALDKNRHRARDLKIEHPEKALYQMFKENIEMIGNSESTNLDDELLDFGNPYLDNDEDFVI